MGYVIAIYVACGLLITLYLRVAMTWCCAERRHKVGGNLPLWHRMAFVFFVAVTWPMAVHVALHDLNEQLLEEYRKKVDHGR